jgi:hypothetical protein
MLFRILFNLLISANLELSICSYVSVLTVNAVGVDESSPLLRLTGPHASVPSTRGLVAKGGVLQLVSEHGYPRLGKSLGVPRKLWNG